MKTLRQYNPGLLILLVMAVAFAIIVVLAFIAAPAANTGFNRRFITEPLKPLAAVPKHADVTAFAGTKNGRLYFATRSPNVMFVTDSALTKGGMKHSGFAVHHPKALRGFNLTVTDSISILYAGNVPAAFTLADNEADSFNLTGHLFTRGVRADSGYYFFRAFDPYNKYTRDQVLLKARPGNGIVAIDSATIPRLHDAGIGTDGQLHYDAVNRLLIYLSYYSNKVYLWSNNLRFLKQARTIDTLSAWQHFIGEKSEGAGHSTLTNVRPKKIINAESLVYNGMLYVRSKIKAENENNSGFRENAVIDCYRTKDFVYAHSFYLPDYKGEKLWSIGVAGNNLVAIYRSYIVRYALPR